MKKVYEICFMTNDNEWHNVIFSSQKRAKTFFEKYYKIGTIYLGSVIINSFVIKRTLF